MKPEKPTRRDPNQGEGDRTSARHDNQQLREFIAGGKVDPAARKAKAYVVSHLEQAEQAEQAARAARKVRRGPTPTRISIDEMIAKSRTLVDRVRPFVMRALGRLRARFGRK